MSEVRHSAPHDLHFATTQRCMSTIEEEPTYEAREARFQSEASGDTIINPRSGDASRLSEALPELGRGLDVLGGGGVAIGAVGTVGGDLAVERRDHVAEVCRSGLGRSGRGLGVCVDVGVA
jgi:hypothetical protein